MLPDAVDNGGRSGCQLLLSFVARAMLTIVSSSGQLFIPSEYHYFFSHPPRSETNHLLNGNDLPTPETYLHSLVTLLVFEFDSTST